MMDYAIQITETGGPEVMQRVDVTLPAPGPGEVRMRNTAIGLNFIDIYHRKGSYPIPLPSGLGLEAAGIIEAVGKGITHLAVGDRVCTFGPALGAYSTARTVDAATLFKTPDGISDDIAAAALLKACTVEALVERCAKVETGWPVLVHAAAGGVGLILCQWLKAVGATVIGTVSTTEKAERAKAAGADHIIMAGEPDLAKQVRALTQGLGVRVVFDGVGAATWEDSLGSCGVRGLIVSYGNASGPVTNIATGVLAQHGSLFMTRPTLFSYYAEAEERAAGAARVFEMIETGAVQISIDQEYALTDARQAHEDLASRRTIGSSVMRP
jgi:NADPH:quinone reductase